jgi:hypothetical protein
MPLAFGETHHQLVTKTRRFGVFPVVVKTGKVEQAKGFGDLTLFMTRKKPGRAHWNGATSISPDSIGPLMSAHLQHSRNCHQLH